MTLEMDDGKDETFEFYYAVIEKRGKKIEMDVEIIKQHAAAVFLSWNAYSTTICKSFISTIPQLAYKSPQFGYKHEMSRADFCSVNHSNK
jgi:hypothetical protein